jgi:hypothetical protein
MWFWWFYCIRKWVPKTDCNFNGVQRPTWFTSEQSQADILQKILHEPFLTFALVLCVDVNVERFWSQRFYKTIAAGKIIKQRTHDKPETQQQISKERRTQVGCKAVRCQEVLQEWGCSFLYFVFFPMRSNECTCVLSPLGAQTLNEHDQTATWIRMLK